MQSARNPSKSELLPVVQQPQSEQTEAVSPATRLLEKRRMMYENQEAYK